MSKSRQSSERDVLVRVWPARHASGASVHFLYQDWVQLVYAAEGVLTVTTADGSWVVPPHRAVWVPAGVRHEVRASGWVNLRSLFFRAGSRMPRKCATVAVTPLARELISYVAEIGPLLRSRASDRRLTQVLLDQIRELSELPFHLPQTSFDITALLRWDLSVDQAAGEMGFSKRTLERRIFEETKLSLGAWRQQARLIESLQLLAGGQSVTNTAFRVGYQSASAFIVAFKRAFGVAPGAFYA